MSSDVLDLRDVNRTQVAIAGGKGANLGELTRIAGVRVPPGFCVTTDAFRRVRAAAPTLDGQIDQLSRLTLDDTKELGVRSGQIRRTIESTAIPAGLAAEITRRLAGRGEHATYAVRSSATAEDQPTASFAGQQDTYLNVVGPASILEHISRCWASLFTERAVTYRLRNGLDHRAAHMAVVVQAMVIPQAAGILFTADPVTGSRRIARVEASFGLGEALVSGLVSPDVYSVRDGVIATRAIGTKRLATRPSPAGGTRHEAVDPERRALAALTDDQVVRLVELGRRIEAHFGRPQDVEWGLADDGFWVLQSRPITTLFPIPTADDEGKHVYISVGHQQMMTDAMRPLGLSVWQLTTQRPMAEAGGRLFVDVTRILASASTRAGFLELAGRSDPLIRDALQAVIDRGDIIPSAPDEPVGAGPSGAPAGGPSTGGAPAPIDADAAIVTGLIARSEASIATLKRDIRGRTGTDLLDFILADLGELRRIIADPQSHQVIMAGMEATWWLKDRLHEWLGENDLADTLTQSVPNNVTSEMGLALLDVADAIRPHPAVVTYLEHAEDEGFLDGLAGIDGGPQARAAISAWLERYGMRCVGEIDITRPRWSERPTALVPVLLGNVRSFEPGAAERRFEQGREEARQAERGVLERLRALPDGASKADEARRMIDRVRTFAGYREYPKYAMISRYFVYKQALLAEADRLVRAGVLGNREDIFYLTLHELRDVVRTGQADARLVRDRTDTYRSYRSLTPPRVLTSDGEAINGAYRRNGVPTGALVGLPVSAGIAEGRARVILDMEDADFEPGDILVTAATDPSWTPLFVTIGGLVTEVGGLMTHGAVIAREYGLPSVVGVEHATTLIRDGQRIRVHGTDGYVEVLPSPGATPTHSMRSPATCPPGRSGLRRQSR